MFSSIAKLRILNKSLMELMIRLHTTSLISSYILLSAYEFNSVKYSRMSLLAFCISFLRRNNSEKFSESRSCVRSLHLLSPLRELFILTSQYFLLSLDEELADKFVQFHDEVASLTLEKGTSPFEIICLFFFKSFYLEIGTREIVKSYLCYLFYIHYFVHTHAVISIFFKVISICVMMILYTFLAYRSMTTFTVALAGALWVQQTF